MNLEQITKNVYAITDGSTIGNVAAFVTDNNIIIIDSGMNIPKMKEFRKELEKVTGKETTKLVLTHFHGDHVFGSQVFSDCDIIASKPTMKRMEESLEKEWTKEQLQERIENSENPEMLEGLEIVLPTKQFEEEYIIADNSKKIIVKRTGGHTKGSSYAYYPQAKALMAGDNLFIERFPWGGDKEADPDMWIDCLEEYLSLDCQYYIPGHGPVSNNEKVKEFLDYIKKIKKVVNQELQAGTAKEEIIKKASNIDFYPPSSEESKRLTLQKWIAVWSES
ncbi:MAG: MBL fold metallo-hydrolase [Asgard group archaeon]|nr:MBL fold metallo-hydrolase [Asgard group archaeon]